MKKNEFMEDDSAAVLELLETSESFRSSMMHSVLNGSEFTKSAVKGKLQGKMSFYAKAEGRHDVVKVATVSLSDLYPWAEGGKSSLLSQFRHLSQRAKAMAAMPADEALEEVATDFWSEIIDLQKYFGCSQQHSTAISSLITLATTGANSFMTRAKAESLERVLQQLGNKITITAEDLVAMFLDLTAANFDLAIAWDFEIPGIYDEADV